MEDNKAPAPSRTFQTVAEKRSLISLSIVTLTYGIGASIVMSGLAHADPMISTANTLSEGGALQHLGFADERVLFALLTFGFSLLAAGVWHRSFRAVIKSKNPSRH
ncbi:hypothetical protein GAO09_26850 [Rhizobiales bacterium RZME27]|uniref:Uncharacterized protein n=1 Tax=Endobacterium cereale TaxID=2663029 RepID=A0A6A8AIV8_9HYPH|nr:hypothetical protein [Endobacterium cereale]MEB2843096.1 hypothetical protein [Endobacterium cereale]MQY49650.1 hypothetical protein [Endobacterium cereale]